MADHQRNTLPFDSQPAWDNISIANAGVAKITSEQISRYAEIVSLISGLESKQKALRAELLELRAVGAEQETGSPYLLSFVDQQRRTVNWKQHALSLALKVFGIEKAAAWQSEVEQAAPVMRITQVRVRPNGSYAAGLITSNAPTPGKKPATPVRVRATSQNQKSGS